MSTILLEKVSREVGEEFYILPAPMRRPASSETFGQYVTRIMKQRGVSAQKVEKKILAEAEKRGLGETHTCSDATIYKIMADEYGALSSTTIIALSWGIERPLDEVVRRAFDLPMPEGETLEPELVDLWDAYKSLSAADDRKYFKRQIESLQREMVRTRRQS